LQGRGAAGRQPQSDEPDEGLAAYLIARDHPLGGCIGEEKAHPRR
jgi:hypothetical protein